MRPLGGMAVIRRPPAICALGGLSLLAAGILIGVFSLSPGPRVAATDAGTALDFNGSNQYVTFRTALGSRRGTTVARPTWVAGTPSPAPPPTNAALQSNGSA